MKRSAPLRRKTALHRRTPLKRTGSLKRTGIKRSNKALKRTRRAESPAEKAARELFAFEVCAVDLCFFADVDLALEPRRPGHVCGGNGGELDPHHLIAKSWIQRYYGDLPEDELLAIKYAPIIGCPLCRDAHDRLPANLNPGDRVFFEELDEDLIDFCERLDRRFAGSGRPSFLTRLHLECPPRPDELVIAGVGGGGAIPPTSCATSHSGDHDQEAIAGDGAEAEGVGLAPSPPSGSAVSGDSPGQRTKEPA